MSGKHPFPKLRNRNAPPPSSTISFRFSRVDEELEEVSPGNKPEAISENKSGYGGSKESIGLKTENSLEGKTTAPSKRKKDEMNRSKIDDKQSDGSTESINIIGNVEKSGDSTSLGHSEAGAKELPVKESVKDYFSRFGRRAASLDSDSSSSETEVWPFLKDLKGRITKNLEDRIGKELVAEGELPESMSFPELKSSTLDSSQDVKVFSASTMKASQSETLVKEDDHLSPSLEATENLEVQQIFEKFASNENKRSNPEQKSPRLEQRPLSQSSPLSSSSSTKQKTPLVRKKALDRPEFNMTLSSLMASRSFSFERDPQKSESNVADIAMKGKMLEDRLKSCISASKIKIDGSNFDHSDDKGSYFSHKFLHKTSTKYFSSSLWNKMAAFVIFVAFLLTIFPFPLLLTGFLTGCFLAGSITYVLMKPLQPKEPFKLPDYDVMDPLVIDDSSLAKDIIYKGWMNELSSEYNADTYHVNCTNSVYIRLDGSHLRISHPRTNIPKRAMFNEPRHELAFIYQRHYDITGASVDLLPEGLNRKRLWSKKYPVCLTIPDSKQSFDSNVKGSPYSTRRPSSGSKESSPAKRFEPKPNENGEVVLYLFARTDREKYDWYYRFLKLSRSKMLKSHSPASTPNISSLESQLENKRTASLDLGLLQQSSSLGNMLAMDDQDLETGEDDAFSEIKFDKHCKFEYYMTQLLSPIHNKTFHSRHGSKDHVDATDSKTLKATNQSQNAQSHAWLNALIGRLFFDFLTEDMWAALVAERIQRKLSKLKLPNFIEELKITDINLGSALPKIHRASNPMMDDRGLWTDIDISYNGSFQMTLETKLNLLKLQRSGDVTYTLSSESKEKEMEEMPIGSRTYDSDDDDSAESSSDDDVPLPEIPDTAAEDSTLAHGVGGGGSTGKKLIRLVDKIAQSSYFQTAAKNKYIKRAMEEVSNMPLVLTVEVHWLIGTLAINIPTMPTDRLWYGFRKNPQLSIVARPKLGCRAVRLTHVTEWIEKKLVLEFQKVLVMPNMDDLIIPIMKSDIETGKT